VIVGAAFCPHPPLLVPTLASGAAAELEELRAACAGAINAVVAPDRGLVLLGSGAQSAVYASGGRGSLAPYGVELDVRIGSPDDRCGPEPGPGPGPPLPLSLTVGAWLVERSVGVRTGAIAVSVGPDFATSDAAGELRRRAALETIALIVMGDGSARRTTRAPGYLDRRAAAFDASVAAALRDADAAALCALDTELGAELLAAGVPAWRAAGALLADAAYDAQLCYDRAPYGVGYLVAAWTAHG
jgi:hypothetical protein